mmetsp:Transcript_2228/g.4769  ORF Transcript_2228/g.4769 Transcript_2228/m.4769 type:complete len:246 (+) Transcript_2228:115-852(+)
MKAPSRGLCKDGSLGSCYFPHPSTGGRQTHDTTYQVACLLGGDPRNGLSFAWARPRVSRLHGGEKQPSASWLTSWLDLSETIRPLGSNHPGRGAHFFHSETALEQRGHTLGWTAVPTLLQYIQHRSHLTASIFLTPMVHPLSVALASSTHSPHPSPASSADDAIDALDAMKMYLRSSTALDFLGGHSRSGSPANSSSREASSASSVCTCTWQSIEEPTSFRALASSMHFWTSPRSSMILVHASGR